MALYTRGANPIWSVPTLVGDFMDDTYWFFTLDNLTQLPAPVYQTPSGTIWSDPIEISAGGALPGNIYFDPAITYRLEWRQGPTESDPLIYVVENYVPGSGSPTPGNTAVETDNQITNPQFADVLFTSPVVITSAAQVTIAPGWSIITTGAGTLTISQITREGNVWAPTNASNASYALQMVNAGFSTVTLRQRFGFNGALWTGKSVAMNFTASAANPCTLTGTIAYSDATSTLLLSAPLTTLDTDYSGAVSIPASTSGVEPDGAWTDIDILFTTNTTVVITSVQVVGQDTTDKLNYIQTTLERQVDQEFNYWQPRLNQKPIPSYLVGWDFPLNPAQFFATTTATTTPKYVWDQTIIGTATGTVTVIPDPISDGLNITNASANEAIYLLQYLSGAQAMQMISNFLAVNINAYTSAASDVVCNIYLYRGSSAAAIPALSTTIGTIANTGVFTLTEANWTLIKRGTPNSFLPQASTAIGVSTTPTGPFTDKGFAEWRIIDPAERADTNKFAIVVTFKIPTISTVLTINSISLVPGEIPTRPAPQTPDEVLRECQFYYEKSYALNAYGTPTSGDNTVVNELTPVQNSLNVPSTSFAYAFASPAVVQFASIKRATPVLYLYTPSGTVATVASILYYPLTGTDAFTILPAASTVATSWTVTASTKSFIMVPKAVTLTVTANNSSASNQYSSASLAFQFVADSRLGVVT